MKLPSTFIKVEKLRRLWLKHRDARKQAEVFPGATVDAEM